MVTARLLFLTLFICTACGKGLENQKGPLEQKDLLVPEASPVPYPIYQFTSTVEGVASYRVSGETDGKVNISDDGWLYLQQPLDWSPGKTHTLNIEGLSSDDEAIDGPYEVTLRVLDVNNNPPIFSEIQYAGSVKELTPSGVPFVRVSASDADDPDTPHAQISYSIISQLPNPTSTAYFSINPNTGEISTTSEGALALRAQQGLVYGPGEARGSTDALKMKFDEYCPAGNTPYENNPFFTCVERTESRRLNSVEDPDYILIVRAEDLGGGAMNALSGTARVNIAITQNLWINPGPINIKENLKADYPMLIAMVHSNDPMAKYRLEQKERVLEFPFTINPSGQIFLTKSLDREQKDMYVLVVFAQDEQGDEIDPPMEIIVTVEDENDNSPQCEEQEAVFEVQESEVVGNVVGILSVHDADDENTPNALLRYEILSQTPDLPSMFSIDPFSGKIQVVKANFRRRDVSQYKLAIKVSDGGHADTAYSTVCKVVIRVIDINNEVPIFEKSNYGRYSVSELAALGSTLLTIKATDADDPGTGSSKVEYHITSGDPQGLFAIETDETTGEGRVYIAKPLDYEAQSSYQLQIDARNPEPLVAGVNYDQRSTATVVIELENVNEPPEFDMDILHVNVAENLTVGTTILKIHAKDPEGQEIMFKMEGDDLGWLELDANTGELKTKAVLDREKLDHLTVRVTVFEKDSPEQKDDREVSIHLLDVNDNIPKLQQQHSFICVKDMAPIHLSALDYDSAPHGEPFTFALARKSPNWEVKAVDGTSAKLSLKKKPISDQTFTIPINIKDNAGMGVTQKLEVRVCNCTSLGYCYIQPDTHAWKYGLPTTIGILGGTFGFIFLIMVIVLHRIKKKNEKLKSKEEAAETNSIL